ncbi:MAG: hypothetical protein AAF696_27110, partial [Bacteroidota bacterium]
MKGFIGLLMLLGTLYTLYDAFNTRRHVWVLVIFFFPGLGPLLYFIVMMLPRMKTKQFTEQATEGIESFFFPEKELKELEERVDMAPSFQN